MFALDLFNTDHERRLAEGAVDQLEQRRIDDLAMKMDDLVARAKKASTPEVRAALVKEFQKCKDERDSYYKIKDECMGYGGLGEAGIGQDIVNRQEKMARATPSTPTGKVASTVKNAAKWLAGKGGPGKEGPTYENQKKNSEEVNEAQRLHAGDPIVVTAPNEFEGKTGEIAEFSPSGSFVVVDLYNHGRHSMHLSDVAYNDYADQEEQDDWYDKELDESVNPQFINAQVTKILAGEARRMTNAPMAQLLAPVMKEYNLTLQQIDGMVPGGLRKAAGEYGIMMKEGFQDFNKVEPYEVCLAGKCVKTFDYYEDARRFHDNWKKKLYRAGDKAKADKITLNPVMKEEEQKPGFGEFPPKQEITIIPPKKLKSGETYQDRNKYWQSQGQAPIYKTNEAGSPAQQAAIAIAMKKAGKKPKSVDENTVQIPHKGKMVSGKVVRKDPVSGEYIVDVGEYGSVRVPAHKVKHDVEETTAFLTRGPRLSYGTQAQHATLGPVQVEKNMPDGSVVVHCERDGKKYRTQPSALKPTVAEDTGSWIVYDPATKQIKKRFKTHTAGKSYARTHGLGFASSEFYFDRVKDNKEVAESAMSNVHAAMADVYHRLAPKIERHRDSFLAGQLYDELENIAELHGIEPEFKRMMAGARNRAHMDYDTNPGGFQNWFWYLPFEDDELAEESSTSTDAVERAILNRIMVAHTDLLMKFGPDKVMQAAEEVAYNVGDVDEIGTSDVSAYVDQVKQILGVEA